jgi:hypothetical protein
MLALLFNPYDFNNTWQSTWPDRVFYYSPAMLIILITNEYSFRTNRQNVIDGWSRNGYFCKIVIA